MLPLAILVATTAMLSGIGGTALFMPIFLLMFPLLGIEYQLDDPITAICSSTINLLIWLYLRVYRLLS